MVIYGNAKETRGPARQGKVIDLCLEKVNSTKTYVKLMKHTRKYQSGVVSCSIYDSFRSIVNLTESNLFEISKNRLLGLYRTTEMKLYLGHLVESGSLQIMCARITTTLAIS